MTQLDPQKVSRYMQLHQQLLQHVSTPETIERLKQKIGTQVEDGNNLVSSLDGSELATFKQQLKELYLQLIQLQISLRQGQNMMLAQAFVLKALEGELLGIPELKLQIPEALKQLLRAVRNSDLLSCYTLFGGIVGAVMTLEELFEGR